MKNNEQYSNKYYFRHVAL